MTTATLPTRSRRVSRQRRAIDIRHSEPEDLWRLAEQLHGRPIPGVRMTEAQFEEWCDEDLRAEWVDGEIIISPPSHFEHASLNTWFTALRQPIARSPREVHRIRKSRRSRVLDHRPLVENRRAVPA